MKQSCDDLLWTLLLVMSTFLIFDVMSTCVYLLKFIFAYSVEMEIYFWYSGFPFHSLEYLVGG